MPKIGMITNINDLLFNSFERITARHLNILNVKDVTESQHLWKTIKPFFTDKTKNSNNILTGNYQTIKENEKICKIFKTDFTNVT